MSSKSGFSVKSSLHQSWLVKIQLHIHLTALWANVFLTYFSNMIPPTTSFPCLSIMSILASFTTSTYYIPCHSCLPTFPYLPSLPFPSPPFHSMPSASLHDFQHPEDPGSRILPDTPACSRRIAFSQSRRRSPGPAAINAVPAAARRYLTAGVRYSDIPHCSAPLSGSSSSLLNHSASCDKVPGLQY